MQVRVDRWEGAVALGKGLAGHVFRGQLNAKWLLSTTLERLAVQQGCFVVPGDLSKSFMENLADCLEVDVSALVAKKVVISMRQVDFDRFFDTPIVNIVLPRKIHNEAVWDLDQMNVNATSLFPGLDGFARSLHTWFRDAI